ncbi:CynX/NimT family MFS transporter [Arthrobacter sp. ISL-69]|uniref:MFS transporter n=1 Tax=Arthrobacter sp. ISL-69 TaxID=2819113 RepID=UPI001BE6F916|nr:MFS transporter [Arthrobacter sp. ISL-69]MBT2535463.1 MFS transporter [Arthrobacter sp. ISL-69]
MKTSSRLRSLPGATAVVKTVALTSVTVSPTFLMGSLVVQMRHDIALAPAAIGLGAAIMFGTGGVLAPLCGRLVQRIGPKRGMLFAASTSAFALAGIAAAPNFLWLALCLVVAGTGNALGQPASNMALSESVPFRRLGVAMGVKQASIPTASLLGGLAVPAVALVFGWRWAFVLAAVLALLVAAWGVGDRIQQPTGPRTPAAIDPPSSRRAMALLTAGGAVAAASATSLGIFLVDSAVSSGISPSHAGVLFAGAALMGLVSRIGAGFFLDRRPYYSPYSLACQFLLVGSVGFLVLAVGQPWAVMAGAVFAYGAGWAWPGVLTYGVMRDRLSSVGTSTGTLQVGLSLGAAAGPLAFGILAQVSSYRISWLVAGLGLAASAAIISRGHAAESRIRKRRPVADLDSISE